MEKHIILMRRIRIKLRELLGRSEKETSFRKLSRILKKMYHEGFTKWPGQFPGN